MGMTASQARLLCITARMHDVEYKAQSLQHAKLQLATQSAQAYQEYVEALDAETLVLRAIDPNSGAKSSLPATFNNLCSKSRLMAANGDEYALKDAHGRLIVEQAVHDGYKNFISEKGDKTAEAFAFYMMNGTLPEDVTKAEKVIAEENKENGSKGVIIAREALEQYIKNNDTSEDTKEITIDDIYSYGKNDSEYQKLFTKFREELYKSYKEDLGLKISGQVTGTQDDIDLKDSRSSAEFAYYVSIYNQIKANGGQTISINSFDGFDGDAANDSDWLTTMIQCGQISISIIGEDDKGDMQFGATSPSSDISLSYNTTSSIDSTAVKKAEAEYEHKLSEIQRKDKKFDLELSKLETERDALDKQREGLKKVIKDNVERTFGIFS